MSIIDYFQYDFIWRGFWVGLLVAILGSIIGHFLVLRKVAMIGHGLSHVAYLSVALTIVFFQQSLVFNLLFVSLVSLLIQLLVKRFPSYADVVIGVISSTAVAIGTIIITTSPNQNVNVEQYLFGSLLLLRPMDVFTMLLLGVVIVIFIGFFYQQLAALSFDQEFSQVVGIHNQRLELALTLLTSWLIILGIRSVGALLISSFIMFPTLISSPLSHSFKGSFVGGIVVSVVVFLVGFLLSLGLDWPTGSTIIVIYSITWIMSVLYQRLIKERRL